MHLDPAVREGSEVGHVARKRRDFEVLERVGVAAHRLVVEARAGPRSRPGRRSQRPEQTFQPAVLQ
jgi:hypothetical protein